ncbi:MAG: TonB family protein [Pseudomonadota bacterium]
MKPSADVVALDQERQKRSDVSEQELTTAGGMLRAAREAMELSIADVAESTNIRRDLIEAIEAMDLKKLPAQAYTMGFVRAYAREVELPDDALMERFRQQAGYELPSSTIPKINAKPSKGGEAVEGGRELSVLALIAILAFGLWCAWSLLMRTAPDAPGETTRFAYTKDDQDPVVPAPTSEPALDAEDDGVIDLGPLTPAEPAPEEAATAETIEPEAASVEPDTSQAAELTPEPEVATPVVPAPTPEPRIALRRTVVVDPVYPPLCETEAADIETVAVRYNINGSGRPVNAQIASSTNPCFNGAALAAIVRWRYVPETVVGTNSRGVSETFTFERPF